MIEINVLARIYITLAFILCVSVSVAQSARSASQEDEALNISISVKKNDGGQFSLNNTHPDFFDVKCSQSSGDIWVDYKESLGPVASLEVITPGTVFWRTNLNVENASIQARNFLLGYNEYKDKEKVFGGAGVAFIDTIRPTFSAEDAVFNLEGSLQNYNQLHLKNAILNVCGNIENYFNAWLHLGGKTTCHTLTNSGGVLRIEPESKIQFQNIDCDYLETPAKRLDINLRTPVTRLGAIFGTSMKPLEVHLTAPSGYNPIESEIVYSDRVWINGKPATADEDYLRRVKMPEGFSWGIPDPADIADEYKERFPRASDAIGFLFGEDNHLFWRCRYQLHSLLLNRIPSKFVADSFEGLKVVEVENRFKVLKKTMAELSRWYLQPNFMHVDIKKLVQEIEKNREYTSFYTGFLQIKDSLTVSEADLRSEMCEAAVELAPKEEEKNELETLVTEINSKFLFNINFRKIYSYYLSGKNFHSLLDFLKNISQENEDTNKTLQGEIEKVNVPLKGLDILV